MKKIIFPFILLFSCPHAFSQDQHLVDSFLTLLKKQVQDTAKANILYSFSKVYWGNDPEKAMDYANQCLVLSEKIGYKKGVANAYSSMGIINWYQSNYLPALEFNKKALKIGEEIGDKQTIAGSYINFGNIYADQGNYPEALKNYLSSLKISEETGDKRGIASAYNNIGTIYDELGNYAEALKNNFASLKINKELQDKKLMAGSYNNIGESYRKQGNYKEAMENFFTALKLNEEIGNKNWQGINLYNIGLIYDKQGNYSEALKKHFASLKIMEELGDKYLTSIAFINIGNSYLKQSKTKEALDYLNKGLSVSKEIGSLSQIRESYASLATLDSAEGNFKQALEHYKMFITTRDSIFSQESAKTLVQHQMQYDFDKKESLTKAEQEKKDAVALKEMQKQKLVRNGFIGGFAVVLLFAGVFFRQRNKISKAKKRSEVERERSEELLLNILPAEVAEEIKTTGTAKAKAFTMATVMFTDFKDFTTVSEKISAELLVDEIHTCFSAFDNILHKYKIEKIKTIGDAYLCASGLPVSTHTHAQDMLNAAFEIREYMIQRKKEKEAKGEIPFELRIGIHTGPVVAGVVGVKKYAYDIWGDTVNLAARVEQNSEAGKVNISGSTFELVKDKFKCEHRGKISAKNKGEIDMYFVEQTVKG